jgi:multidrug efflux pump subunit AcrA (membrane-fusion protein)
MPMKPSATETAALDRTDPINELPAAAVRPWIDVTTQVIVAATPGKVWSSLVFYEGIEEPPPWYLQLLLPRPIRTQGDKAAVGDQATCLYQGGHLLKRVTRIDPDRRYEFTVVEQNLGIHGGIKLSGGSYVLDALGGDRTTLSITTRYSGGRRPRWLARPVEAAVCHLFHRHLLNAIKTKAESAPPIAP